MRRRPSAPLLAMLLIGAGVVAACSRDAPGQGEASAPPAPSPGPLPAPVPPTPAQRALLAQLPPAYRGADLGNGELHLALCRPCHSFTAGGPNMTGPNLHGVFGRRVASVADFSYSPALAARTWTWDAPHLDGWLKSPRSYVPGTKMTFYGIPDDQDRRDLIAYLKIATSDAR